MDESSKLKRAVQRLSGHVLENITLLKMLEAYGDQMDCKLVEQGREWAVLLCLPASCSSYDRAVYPEAKSIVFVGGTDTTAILELLNRLTIQKPVIFKTQKEEYRQVIESKYQVEKIRSFYTYSCLERIPEPEISEIVEEDVVNENLIPLWSNNGYDSQELRKMFEQGARSYTLYEAGEPVSTCLTFHNYGPVWEIGAVNTRDDHRGKGYAKKIVTAAVNYLLVRKFLPRYQVLESNWPSIKVAESLGLTRVVTLEHLYFGV
ncbi:GNAT family N-acetyltransferase [Paenibacillus sp. RC67]|uniref:GNAT family N-acetyltransferase n=1 Tax=Paenibacillus sp. RC67 TaxID=3039392 RepID=UPI0024AE7F21|nr:GNAT family N-acetyltransferase [Paenibacillus sp. RC67]